METSPMKRVLAVLALIAFIGALLAVTVALYADTLYRTCFGRDAAVRENAEAEITSFDLLSEENQHQMLSRVSGWLSTVSSQEVSVASPRGKLAATHYEPVGGAADAPWAIVFHGGVSTDRSQVQDIACVLSINGYHVLTPDLYAHGESEGSASTLGYGDAQDVFSWVSYVEGSHPGARIVLFGQDEGAAAVLTAVSGGLESRVCAVAADSACDDGDCYLLKAAGEEDGFHAWLLKLVFHRRAQSTDVKLSERIHLTKAPLLLIHGTGDEVTPAWNSEDIVAAAGDNARLLFVEGAGHGLARALDPQTVYASLLSFYEEAIRL